MISDAIAPVSGPAAASPGDVDPIVSDEAIDTAEPGADEFTALVKRLEHYGAKFPPWFWDQPTEEVRAGLREAARSEKVRETYRREQEAEANRQPEICTTEATIHEMSEDALAALNKWNSPPELFARSACLVRAALDERGCLYIQELDENGLTGILDRLIAWTRLLKGGEERPVHPPREVVRDILSLPAAAWRVPYLAGVTGTPIFNQRGIVHTEPGYDPESCLYFYPTPGFTMPPVPEVPTREDVAAALETIGEVIIDMPFCSPADRANAIGALFTAVLRPCIDGPVPMYVTTKAQAGSGASLLQRVIGWIAEGREPALKTMPSGLEMRKELFSTLKNGTRILILDNVEDRLSSPELAAALTASEMTGRILGQTEERTYAVRTFWMSNGINITIGGDLARRTFMSRIDPQDPMPWQRHNFRYPDLIGWVRGARGVILAAIFTMARAWIQAGRPAPAKVPRVGSYDAWRDMIGGILESAGVPDFLGNADMLYLEADADRVQWEGFLQGLWKIYGCDPFRAGRVADLLITEAPGTDGLLETLPDALADTLATKRKAFSRELGRAFTKINGRHFPGGWCLKQGALSKGTRNWVITYSPPADRGEGVGSGVGCNSDEMAPKSGKGGGSPESEISGRMGRVTLLPTRKEKEEVYNSNGEEKINARRGETNPTHPTPSTLDNDVGGPNPKNSLDTNGDNPSPHPTPILPLDPPPPGCLKHPIEAYVPRKYDSSILCIVPGCRRHAEYAAGAGFPLCEEHYQAAKRQAAGRGGDPR